MGPIVSSVVKRIVSSATLLNVSSASQSTFFSQMEVALLVLSYILHVFFAIHLNV